MPKAGMPLHGADPTVSHTSTQQWQSFEIRMRHRRAERCLERARAAIAAGLEEEARAALDEAQALTPEAPRFEALLAEAEDRQLSLRTDESRSGRLALTIAASLIALLGIGVAWFGVPRLDRVDPLPSAPATDAPSGTAELADPQPAKPAGAVASGSEPAPAVDPVAASAPVPTTGRDPRVTEEPRAPVTIPAVAGEAVPAVGKAAAPPVGPSTSDLASTGVSGASESVDRMAAGLPSAAAPVPLAPVPPVPQQSQEPQVRALLAQFAAAYSSLSASAARELWPTVDERALARAFDGLQSQQVSLGACTLTMAVNTARATCNGVTTWTPKIGGGARAEPTRWTFELASTNGAWHIVRADAR